MSINNLKGTNSIFRLFVLKTNDSYDLKFDMDPHDFYEQVDSHQFQDPENDQVIFLVEYKFNPGEDSKKIATYFTLRGNSYIPSGKKRVFLYRTYFLYDEPDIDYEMPKITLYTKAMYYNKYLTQIRNPLVKTISFDPINLCFIADLTEEVKNAKKIEFELFAFLIQNFFMKPEFIIYLRIFKIEKIELAPNIAAFEPDNFHKILVRLDKNYQEVLQRLINNSNKKAENEGRAQDILEFEEALKKFNQINLYFFRHFKKNYFIEFIKDRNLATNNEFTKEAMEMIISNGFAFKGLEYKELQELFNLFLPLFSSDQELYSFLLLSQKITDFLELVIKNFDECVAISKKKVGDTEFPLEINVNSCELKQEDNLDLLFTNFKSYKELESSEHFAEFSPEIWIEYIKIFSGDFANLLKLKNFLKNSENYEEDDFRNIFQQPLGDAIHDLFISKINNGEVKNSEIVPYFKEDDLYREQNFQDYYDLYPRLGINIYLDELDDNFISEFKSLGFIKGMEPFKMIDFAKEIINNVNNIDSIQKLLNLFFENEDFDDESTKEEIVDIIYNKFILLLENAQINEELIQIISNYFLTFSSYLGDSKGKEIYLKVQDLFEKKVVCSLYLKMMKSYKNQEIVKNMIIYLAENANSLSDLNAGIEMNSPIISLIDIIKNSETSLAVQKEYFKILFDNLISGDNNKLFDENEFFKKYSPNLDLYMKLTDMKFFKTYDSKNWKYVTKTKQTISALKNKLNNLDFDKNFAFTVNQLDEKERKKRLLLIYEREVDANNLWNKIESKVKKALEYSDHISCIIAYSKYFYYEDSTTEVKKWEDLRKSLDGKKLSEYEQIQLEINNLENRYAEVKNYLRLINYESFGIIFKNYKIQSLEINEKRDKAKDDFNKLLDIFKTKDIKAYLRQNKTLIRDILNELNTEDKIKKEFSTLKADYKFTIDTTEIIKNLKILASKQSIKAALSSLIKFLDAKQKILTQNLILTDYYTNLKKYYDDVNKNEDMEIEEILSLQDKILLFNINVNQPQKHISLIKVINKKIQVLNFITNKSETEIQNLKDCIINNAGDEFLKGDDIDDLIKVIEFDKELNNLNNKPTKDSEFILKLINLLKKDKYKSIDAHFQNVIGNFGSLNDLDDKIKKNPELCRKSLLDIASNSEFKIYLKNKQIFCEAKIHGSNQTLNLDRIIAIRDKSTVKTDNENNKIYASFSELVNYIIKLKDTLYSLYEIGDPKIYNYSVNVNISNNKENYFMVIDNSSFMKEKEENIEQKIKTLLKKIQNMKTIYDYLYKTYEGCRFIYEKQFASLYNYVSGRNEGIDIKELKTEINYINNLITKNRFEEKNFSYSEKDLSNLSDSDKKFLKERDDKSFSFLFDIVKIGKNYINKLISDMKIDPKDWYQDSLVKNDLIKPGISTLYISANFFERDILNATQINTGKIPQRETFLFCSSETTPGEITSFLHRAYFCTFNAFFIITNTEDLSIDSIFAFTTTISKLHEEKLTDMKATLCIYYTELKTNLIDRIKQLKGSQMIQISKDRLESKVKLEDNSINIVCSNASGLGKSFYIRNKASTMNFEYIYFPIGGEFTRYELVARLQKLIFNKNKKSMLHIDISDSQDIKKMRTVLFSLLILNYFSDRDKIFTFNKENICIEVEVPFGFDDYFSKFRILDLFKKRHTLTKEKMEVDNPLFLPKDKTSNIQIVLNYLNLFRNNLLQQAMMYIEGVNSEVNKENQKYYQNINLESDPITSFKLLTDYLKSEEGEKPTYYQIDIFTKIVANQLKYFTNNAFFFIGVLGERKMLKMRHFLVKSILEITKHFTRGAYGDLINRQNVTLESQEASYDTNKAANHAFKHLVSKKPVSFNEVKPSLIFFTADGQSISVIYTCDEKSTEYRDIYSLLKTFTYPYEPKLTSFRNEQNKKVFLKELFNILYVNESKEKPANVDEIVKDYVFTSDNYIKMILILIRIRASVPVILMGETGCGKTSLIRILSKLTKKTEEKWKQEYKIFNIHAGVNDQEIINFLVKEKLFADQDNSDYQTKKNELVDKIWVFLDEINTCNSMGLIAEMMTRHTAQGRKLNPRVTFIGACNPYREFEKKVDDIVVGLVKKGHKTRKLVYTVNPPPHSLLNFVFDFGNLTPVDEERYIENMIKTPIEQSCQYLSENKTEICNDLKARTKKAIMIAQNYVRDHNDASSVSLREIRRVVILYKWFIEYLIKKEIIQQMENKEKKEELDFDNENLLKQLGKYVNKNILIKSVKLCLFICYFLRIYIKEQKTELDEKLSSCFEDKKFLNVPEQEMDYLVKKIELGEGIAPNTALKTNLFTIFVGINTYQPVFICGKPGCSKSLSVQLIFKSMRGSASDKLFFKMFPRVIMNCFQGSEDSKSEGVLKIFEVAREVVKNNKKKKKESQENIISLIFFDEMGLAEISKHNPLKVIHAELDEFEEKNKDKVSFIGISNWVLDASKMNRGIYLSIAEPDLSDLEKTAQIIAQSYRENLLDDKNILELIMSLCRTYYDYKKKLFKEDKEKADFHGSRDFYSLIKIVCSQIIKEEEINTFYLAQKGSSSLERNFGGLLLKNNITSISLIKNIFGKIFGNVDEKLLGYDVMECFKNNIQDPNGRYLLVISNTSVSPFLIENTVEGVGQIKNYQYILGSKFEKDQNEDIYKIDVLAKVQKCMEKGNILTLCNLSNIYPSLYDLFNQNFTDVNGRKYSRIASGSSETILREVNHKFRCIVLVNQNEVDKEEPPFLNRFEKHYISFDYELGNTPEKIKALKNFEDTVESMITPYNQELNIYVDLKKQLINCNSEEIKGLIFNFRKIYNMKNQESEEKNKNLLPPSVILQTYEAISTTLSQDIIAFIQMSQLKSKERDLQKRIIDKYNTLKNKSINEYLNYVKEKKCIIYTFTNYYHEIEFGQINIGTLKNIKENSILIKEVGLIQRQRDIEKIIEEYYKDQKMNICIFKFLPRDVIHMNHIKSLIENYEKNNIQDESNIKMFIFIVYMKREIKVKKVEAKNDIVRKESISKIVANQVKKDESAKEEIDFNNNGSLISRLSQFDQIFIDDLNGSYKCDVIELSKLSNDDLFAKFIDMNSLFQEHISEPFIKIKYNFKKNEEDNNKYVIEYVDSMIKSLRSNKVVQNLLLECIKKQLKKEKSNKFYESIFYEDKTLFESFESSGERNSSFVDLFKKYVEKKFLSCLNKLIIYCEKLGILSPILLSKKGNTEEVKALFELSLNEIDFTKDKLEIGDLPESNIINSQSGMNIPNISLHLKLLTDEIYKIKDNNFEMEDRFRKTKIDKDNNNKNSNNLLKEAENRMKSNLSNAISKFEDIPFFKKLIKSNKMTPEMIEMIKKDYLNIYLKGTFDEDKIDNLKKIINEILIVKRFGKENTINYKDSLVRIILWLETNQNYINKLLSFYITFSLYIPELYEKIKETITEGKIKKMDVSEKEEMVNSPFYYLLESLLLISLDQWDLFDLKDDKSFNFITALKNFSEVANQLNKTLLLKSNQIYFLQNFIKTYETLSVTGVNSPENIKGYINLIKSEKDNEQEGAEYIDNQYKFLEEKIKDKNKFSSLIIEILYVNFIHNDDPEVRKKILDKILQSNLLISKIQKFLPVIFKKSVIPENSIESNEDDCNESFMKCFEEENPLLITLNDKQDSVALNDILLFYFEIKINNYFLVLKGTNQELQSIYFNVSFSYLQKSIEENVTYVDTITDPDNNDPLKPLSFLRMIYASAYIKVYLNYYVPDLLKDPGQIQSCQEINKTIFEGTTKFNKTVKIYFLKLIVKFYNNFYKLQGFDWGKHNIDCDWDNENIIFHENNNYYTDYLHFDITKQEDFEEKNIKFFEDQVNKFGNTNNGMTNKINTDGFMTYFDIILNNMLYRFSDEEFINSNDYKDFSEWIIKIINPTTLPDNTKKLLKLFYEKESFKKIYGKMNKNNLIYYFSLFKLCYTCISSPNSFYSSLLSNDIVQKIKNSYIPGVEPTVNKYITNVEYANYLLENYPNLGIYMCSCYKVYTIRNSTYPSKKKKCIDCGKDIGGENNKLVNRKDHFRIYKHQEGRDKYGIPFKNIDELNQKANEMRKSNVKGVSAVTISFFINELKIVRDLNPITYRLLSLAFYTIIYFAIELNYIGKEQIKDYLPYKQVIEDDSEKNEPIPIEEVLSTSWNLLKKELYENKIYKIEIFLNIIFPKLFEIISRLKDCNKPDSRKNFEEECNNMIKENINKYKENYVSYIKFNSKILNLKDSEGKYSLKAVLKELVDPFKVQKEEDDYYLLQYFLYDELPSPKSLSEFMNKEDTIIKENYKVISIYLDYLKEIEKRPIPKIKKLEEIIPLNNFLNDVLNIYDYRISREEAKNKKIEEIIGNDANLREKFASFKQSWERVKELAKNYQGKEIKHQDNPNLSIDEQKRLAYVLNDDKETENGMHIAAMYESLIKIQNDYIDNILKSISNENDSLYYCKDELRKEVCIQNATKYEILDFDFQKEINNYENLMDMLSVYSKRKCYELDASDKFTCNYEIYNSLDYDLKGLNDLLGVILFTGKKRFKEEQRFIIYTYEAFRGERSNLLVEFSKKYAQTNLNTKQINILLQLKTQHIDFSKFMFNIQYLIYYLNKESFPPDSSVGEIISKKLTNIKIETLFKNFFTKNCDIKINVLMEVLDYMEYFSFDNVKTLVSQIYKEKIEQQNQQNLNLALGKNKLITNVVLATAVRKFITRHLGGVKSDFENQIHCSLFNIIEKKDDLWPSNIFDNKDFTDEINNLGSCNILIKNCVSLYDVLGGDKSEYENTKKK